MFFIKSKPIPIKEKTETFYESLSAGIKFVFKNQLLLMSNVLQNNNGQTQVNSTRDLFNHKVSRLRILGSTKKAYWDSRRRNQSI